MMLQSGNEGLKTQDEFFLKQNIISLSQCHNISFFVAEMLEILLNAPQRSFRNLSWKLMINPSLN